jgi:hypothetical protein
VLSARQEVVPLLQYLGSFPQPVKPNDFWLVGAATRVRAAAETLVDGLPAFKAGLDRVPVLDGRFAHAPTEEYDLVLEAAGKIEQSGFEVLYLHPDGVDFGDAFADALQVVFHFGAQPGYFAYVNPHAAGKIDLPRQL